MVAPVMFDRLTRKKKLNGYMLLAAIIAVNIFGILLLKGRVMWEREIQRDLEEELIFRAKQYVTAIELFKIKNTNLYPKNFEELYEKKFLRKEFKDPFTESGEWDVVMEETKAGKKSMLIVPLEFVEKYVSNGTARIIGVCSKCPDEAYREYRKKKKYNEWAFYLGEDESKDMPSFTNIGSDGKGDSSTDGKSGPIPDGKTRPKPGGKDGSRTDGRK
jgi:hypothetical protein